ncbi:MAG: helix-turn-helix domain-containing protein [Acidimicrobiia bacterium]|nr:helix-turn-helix domain-containing protein [Acidimicrobiia bacterium]
MTTASAPIPEPSVAPVLPVEEAGRYLGLGRSAAYAAVARGEIPALRIGRRVVVPTAALRRLLALDEEAS